MEYVIGIDTGATKSHLALFDTSGTLVDFGHWGPLNHEALPGSFDQFKNEVSRFVNGILVKNNLTFKNVAYAVFGIAGVDTKNQHKIVSGIMKKIGFKKFTLVNDAFLGIFAGSPAGKGICAINGTGCTLAGINGGGKTLQIGGVGYISADYGGGGMLGEMAVSAVYSELFRKGEATSLTPALMEKLGIKNKRDFVDKIYEKFEDDTLSSRDLVKMLFKAVKKNDSAASRILSGAGISYANGISCMIEELKMARGNEEINIVFAGSVFVKGEHPLLLNTIKEKLKKDNPSCGFKFTLLNVPPVAGAIYWALCNLGVDDKLSCYNKICKQLKK